MSSNQNTKPRGRGRLMYQSQLHFPQKVTENSSGAASSLTSESDTQELDQLTDSLESARILDTDNEKAVEIRYISQNTDNSSDNQCRSSSSSSPNKQEPSASKFAHGPRSVQSTLKLKRWFDGRRRGTVHVVRRGALWLVTFRTNADVERSMREFKLQGYEIRAMKDAETETKDLYEECRAKSAHALHTSDQAARRTILHALGSHLRSAPSPLPPKSSPVKPND